MAVSTSHHNNSGAVQLERLLYRSTATHTLGNLYLFLLLSRAREANARVGITGHLVYDRGGFVQCVEGPVQAVEALWQKLQLDERHHSIELLERHPIEHRRFPEWTMAFSSHASFGQYDMPGFFPLLEAESENLIRRCSGMDTAATHSG